MVIELVSTCLNSLQLKGAARTICQKALVRIMVRASTYKDEKVTFRNATDKEIERRIFRWWKDLIWNGTIATHLWRGIHGYFRLDGEFAVAASYGVSQADLGFIRANLTTEDVLMIIDSPLNWRVKPISESEVVKVIHHVRPTIRNLAHKLRYLKMLDPSTDDIDISGMLTSQAMLLIYIYESKRRGLHLENSVRLGLQNFARDENDKWNSQKRCSSGRQERDTGEKDSTGKPIIERINTTMRRDLYLPDANDPTSTCENPEVLHAAIAKHVSSEETMTVAEFIQWVTVQDSRVGKYLADTVTDNPSDLDEYFETKYPIKDIVTDDDKTPLKVFDKHAKVAREFYRITDADIANVVRQLEKCLNFHARKKSSETAPVWQELEQRLPGIDVTPSIPTAYYGYN